MERQPVEYMLKSKNYYFAQGFENAYQWAKAETLALHPIDKPLSECRISFVTTAVPDGDIPKMKRVASHHLLSDMPQDFRTDELSWDKQATHTRDRSSYIPHEALLTLLEDGFIGSISNRFHFIPTEYSQKNTTNEDAPAIVRACVEDEVDVVILVPL